jgi:peptidyl-prolyl cis-trans isomerase D
VNGVAVPGSEFERQVGYVLRIYQQQTGQPLTREAAEALGVRDVAVENLVSRQLVVQEAQARGLGVTDEEISRTVHETPTFQQGGRFDYALYERETRAQWGSPARYEALLRDDLLYRKMVATVRETTKVSDAELRAAWQADRDRATLAFLRIPLAAARAEAKPSDADAKAFAAANGPRIETFYKENASRYDTRKKVRARHVLVRVAADAPAAQADAARKRIDAAAERVRKGEDFGKVAAEVSDDAATKAKGGELGFLAEPLLEKPLADAAFALAPGQVSEPVRTSSGWDLLQVEEVVPAKTIPLEAVRLDIARELLVNERAAKLAQATAEAALAAAKAGKQAPVKLGAQTVAWEDTGSFALSDASYVPRLGAVPGLVDDVRSAQQGAVLPKVYASPEGPVVAVVKARERPDPAKFEAERAQVALRVSARKEQLVEQAWLKALRQAAKVEVNEPLVRGLVAMQEER